MYKGKRRRLRKKDLNEQTTLVFNEDVWYGKYKIALKGTKRRFFSRKSVGMININGHYGDILSLFINMDLEDIDGNVVFEDRPYILLPEVEGRKYYWVDEDQA